MGKLKWTRKGRARGPKEEIKGAEKQTQISSLQKKNPCNLGFASLDKCSAKTPYKVIKLI